MRRIPSIQHAALAAVVAAAALPGACGGSDSAAGAGTSTGGAMTPAEVVAHYCATLAAPFCQALYACCMDPTRLTHYADVDDCTTGWAQECVENAPDLPTVIADGRTTLDEAALSACAAELTDLAGAAPACTRMPGDLLLRCFTSFRGSAGPGDPCVGDLLEGSFIECRGGLCDGTTCVPYLSTGAACSLSDPSMGLCDWSVGDQCILGPTGGVCGQPAEEGAPCTAPNDKTTECYSLLCGADGTCDPISDKDMCKVP